ncbi:MAG: hypothetical protein EPN88_15560 [Bacteroidetes bacterium]|nr:MAG: hypothetical protein EPN88_15560 [Bacteroidota bacterium]
MKRLIPVILLISLFSSCRKSESDFIWEKSYGKGEAFFIKASSDSGFAACGEIGGNPYFIRFNKTRKMVLDFKSENPGLFSSAWFDTSGYITAGNTGGKMLLMRYSAKGNKLWEKSLDGGYKIDYTNLFYTGNGNLLALGSASPDSSNSGPTGLLFVRFDTTGQIITEKKITDPSFVSANEAALDNAGNIYLPLTRQVPGAKPKASVAKYNDLFQKIWETELYNNPDFGAASVSIKIDGSGNVYVSGKTELSTAKGVLNNSFLASLTNSGSVRWKKYLENSNEGSALAFDAAGNLVMLNKNCFIMNIFNPADGTDAGRIMTLSLCDSYNTDAIGLGLDVNYDKNILISGTRGGSFYLALKSSQ